MRNDVRRLPGISVNSKVLTVITILYIYIPVMFFVAGFTKWYISIPTLFVTGMSVGAMIFSFLGMELLPVSGKTSGDAVEGTESVASSAISKSGESDVNVTEKAIHIDAVTLVIVFAVFIAICILSGWGGIYPQSGDWYKHNAVLSDLTVNDWPVYYTMFDDCMLTYYLGQYIIPALTGKLFGSFMVSNYMMAVWGILGLYLVYLNLVRVVNAGTRKKQLVTMLFLLFFGGALSVAQIVLTGIYGEFMNSLGSYHWILVKNIMLQYRNNYVMLRWVFPQCIVPWLVCIMLFENRRRVEYYVTLVLPVLLYGSFSFVALFVTAVAECTILVLSKKVNFKKVVSLSNLLVGISLGSILFFYFLGNLQVEKPYESSFRWQLYSARNIWVYIVFCLFMFGIHAIIVYKDNAKNSFWYISVAILLFLPFCRMGLCNDVVMSTSIPAQFFILIMVLQTLFRDGSVEKDGIDYIKSLTVRKTIIIVLFVIGSWYPLVELCENIRLNWPGMEVSDAFNTMEWFTDRESDDVTQDLKFNYYTYDMDDTIFYKYYARNKLDNEL